MIPRIVSLLPSATEIVAALGFADALVGRSHECDFPPEVDELPVCTAPKVGGATTREIHESVGSVLQHEASVYSVDAGLLRELDPTHVVTQIQCEVCAVSLRDVQAALADWKETPPEIVTLNPQSLDDVFADIARTAVALGVRERGERLVAEMRRRMNHGKTPAEAGAPRVFAMEWMDPLMAAGNWMPTLIEHAGGTSVLAEPGGHSPWITWDDVENADPDVVIVMPCGFDIAAVRRDAHLLENDPRWRALRAVREGRAFIADGNQYFNRPGPRLADSVEILAEMLHAVDFGHSSDAWVRF
jgi:iron complex transport system substrate-binding protein